MRSAILHAMVTQVPVLIVDDDQVSGTQLSAIAQAAGYSVRVVYNGREAWDALTLSRFRVVISDWYMPELDGVELCRRVRASQRGVRVLHTRHVTGRQTAIPHRHA